MVEKLKVYGPALAIIIIWWTLAFNSKPHLFQPIAPSLSQSSYQNTDADIRSVDASIVINRDSLKQALAGDFVLMLRLITDWDVDAQLLQAKGINDIERLPHIDFLRAQMLGRAVASPYKNELVRLQNESNIHDVIDDTNNKISLKVKYRRFLPQTYAAARNNTFFKGCFGGV